MGEGEELVEDGVGCRVAGVVEVLAGGIGRGKEGVIGVLWIGAAGRRGRKEDGENAAGGGVDVVEGSEEGFGVLDHLSSIRAGEDRTRQRGGYIRYPAKIMSSRGNRIPQTLKRLVLRLRLILIRYF